MIQSETAVDLCYTHPPEVLMKYRSLILAALVLIGTSAAAQTPSGVDPVKAADSIANPEEFSSSRVAASKMSLGEKIQAAKAKKEISKASVPVTVTKTVTSTTTYTPPKPDSDLAGISNNEDLGNQFNKPVAVAPYVAPKPAPPAKKQESLRERKDANALAITKATLPDSTLPKKKRTPIPHSWHAFVRDSTVSKDELSEAYRHNDQKVLRADCRVFLKRAHEKWDDLKDITTCEDYADYIKEDLIAKPCPVNAGLVGLDRVRGNVVNSQMKRKFGKDEMCLYNPNMGRWEASLSCGNFINGSLSVATVMKDKPGEVDALSLTRPLSDLELGQLARDAMSEHRHNRPPPMIIPSEGNWFQRNWKWAVPTGLAVAAGVYECATDWCVSHIHQEQTVIVNGQVVVSRDMKGIGISIPFR